uniref:SPK domain-containing protein n=2 Tax=Caenorhabditis tropicalis TaxID=1561998 RepID=A0A1I7US04_9PELO
MENEMFNGNGKVLCPMTIAAFESLLVHLDNRIERKKNKVHGKRTPVYKALCRQHKITKDIIRIGKQSFTVNRLKRVVIKGLFNNEFYKIPE